jgi:prepilin-type N-terminal cleavage/methylation domain-containing protein
MKILPDNFIRPSRTAVRAFTLVEMIVAISVFSLVILATIAMQIYASRVYTLAATRLTATEQARATMNDIRDQVRNARLVDVGQYTAATGNPLVDFSAMTNGDPQQGNALMIYPTTSTASFTLVFLQPGNGSNSWASTSAANDNQVIMLTYTNGSMENSNIIADYVTNQYVFDAENFEGAILSSNENNYLIHMTLSFSQWEYPIAYIGSNSFNAYDYYQLNTVMTRRDTD